MAFHSMTHQFDHLKKQKGRENSIHMIIWLLKIKKRREFDNPKTIKRNFVLLRHCYAVKNMKIYPAFLHPLNYINHHAITAQYTTAAGHLGELVNQYFYSASLVKQFGIRQRNIVMIFIQP
jgi:hypothetical protein